MNNLNFDGYIKNLIQRKKLKKAADILSLEYRSGVMIADKHFIPELIED